MQWRSRYSHAHTLSTSLSTLSSKRGNKTVSFFLTIFMRNRALSLVHILSTSSAKCGPRPSVFYGLYVKSSSGYTCLVRILSTTFRIEARTRGNRHPPAATTDSHFTRTNAGFCARECFQPWIHTFPDAHTLPNYLMMMWLTWWCGWHDDWGDDVVAMMVRQLAVDNRP